MLAKSKLNSLKLSISSTNWHGNKPWYDYEGEEKSMRTWKKMWGM